MKKEKNKPNVLIRRQGKTGTMTEKRRRERKVERMREQAGKVRKRNEGKR